MTLFGAICATIVQLASYNGFTCVDASHIALPSTLGIALNVSARLQATFDFGL
jgi:hypothetical protein